MVDWTGRPRRLCHPSCWLSSVSSTCPLPTVKWPRLLPCRLWAPKTGSRNFQDTYQTQHHFLPIPLFKSITDCSWPWGRPHACRREGMEAAPFQTSYSQAGRENCSEPKRSSLTSCWERTPPCCSWVARLPKQQSQIWVDISIWNIWANIIIWIRVETPITLRLNRSSSWKKYTYI